MTIPLPNILSPARPRGSPSAFKKKTTEEPVADSLFFSGIQVVVIVARFRLSAHEARCTRNRAKALMHTRNEYSLCIGKFFLPRARDRIFSDSNALRWCVGLCTCVFVRRGRGQGTSDPVVYVEAFGQKFATEVAFNRLSAFFDETFVIDLENIGVAEFKEGVFRWVV